MSANDQIESPARSPAGYLSRIITNPTIAGLATPMNTVRRGEQSTNTSVSVERLRLFTRGGRSRSSSIRPPFNGARTYTGSSGSLSKSKKGKSTNVIKDIYLVDKDVTAMPKGAEKAQMHQSGQVLSAFTIIGYTEASHLYTRIEEAFSNVLDMSKPAPR